MSIVQSLVSFIHYPLDNGCLRALSKAGFTHANLSVDFLTLSKETQAKSRLNATTSPDFQKSVNGLQILAGFLLGFYLKFLKILCRPKNWRV